MLVCGNANARIGNSKAQGLRLRGFEFNSESHFARGGELNRVCYEVNYDLAESSGISPHISWYVCRNVAQELDSFFICTQSQRPQRFFQTIVQVEVGDLQIHLSGLDFGEIENFVDYCEERICRRLNNLKILALLYFRMTVESQISHANHAIQRSTDLVAHIGQKFTLGGISHFGRPSGLQQLLFRLLAFANVAKGPNSSVMFGVLVVHRRRITVQGSSILQLDFVPAGLDVMIVEVLDFG